MNKSFKKFLLISISIISSLFFLWLAFRKIEWSDFFQIAKHANIWLILLAIIIFVVSYFLRTLRWQVLIGSQNRIKLLPAFDSLVSGYAINNVLPLRAGEVFRLFITKLKTGIPKSTVLGTLIIERVWDALALLFLAVISLLLTQPKNVPTNVINLSAIIFGILTLLIIILIIFDRSIVSLLQRVKISDQIIEKITQLVGSFKNLQNLLVLFLSILFSILVWTTEAITYFIVAKSLAMDISFMQTLLVMVILNFGILIPSSPGYVGTFEYFTILGISIFGINRTDAASFAIILHIAQFIPITLYGGLVISKIGFGSINNYND